MRVQHFEVPEGYAEKIRDTQEFGRGPAFPALLSCDQLGQVRALGDAPEIGRQELGGRLRRRHACEMRILAQLQADKNQGQHHGARGHDIGNGGNRIQCHAGPPVFPTIKRRAEADVNGAGDGVPRLG